MGKKFDGQNLMLIISLFLILLLSYCSIPSRDNLHQPAESQGTQYVAQDGVEHGEAIEASTSPETVAQVEEPAELEEAAVEVEKPAEVEESAPGVEEPAPAEETGSGDAAEAEQAAVEGLDSGMPAVIAMDNSIYEAHKKGIVQFTHEKHLADYGIGCGDCHHGDDGSPLTDMQLGDDAVGCAECHSEPGTAPKSKDTKLSDSERLEYHAEAMHDNCITCHKDYNKKNNTKDAPASCTKCHPRK